MAPTGNSASVHFSSCRPTTSGAAASSQASRLGSRRRTLLTLKVAIFMRLLRQERQILPDDGRGGERGDLRHVVGGSHLDHVHAGEGQAPEPAQDRLRLPARKPADLRRAGAGGEGGIE